jgi:flagellar motor component MotA
MIDDLVSSIYVDGMSEAVSRGSRMVEAAADPDPATGLAAVAALRGLVEVLEQLQVDSARANGWSWRNIARVLGVSKQATHYKHAGRLRGRR